MDVASTGGLLSIAFICKQGAASIMIITERDTAINGCSVERDTAINGFSLERLTAFGALMYKRDGTAHCHLLTDTTTYYYCVLAVTYCHYLEGQTTTYYSGFVRERDDAINGGCVCKQDSAMNYEKPPQRRRKLPPAAPAVQTRAAPRAAKGDSVAPAAPTRADKQLQAEKHRKQK
eukprot:5882974-Pyramimonas_sp.AAC.1